MPSRSVSGGKQGEKGNQMNEWMLIGGVIVVVIVLAVGGRAVMQVIRGRRQPEKV